MSLKAVLLHITNQKPAVPIAYSTDTKETYEKCQLILEKVNYKQHGWRICCDLKVVGMLAGLQEGWVKYPCFLCDWDSRHYGIGADRTKQYKDKTWVPRDQSEQKGNLNQIREPLVKRGDILIPPLHVKLGIVKSFVRTVAKKDKVLDCLKQIFPSPHMSLSKLKAGKYDLIVQILYDI